MRNLLLLLLDILTHYLVSNVGFPPVTYAQFGFRWVGGLHPTDGNFFNTKTEAQYYMLRQCRLFFCFTFFSEYRCVPCACASYSETQFYTSKLKMHRDALGGGLRPDPWRTYNAPQTRLRKKNKREERGLKRRGTRGG